MRRETRLETMYSITHLATYFSSLRSSTKPSHLYDRCRCLSIVCLLSSSLTSIYSYNILSPNGDLCSLWLLAASWFGIAQWVQRLEYGLDDWGIGIRLPVGSRDFPLVHNPRLVLEHTQPPTQWIPGDVFSRVTRQRRENDHSPPHSAEVENDGAISPLFMAWCLIN
jgi:hypothetical protein